MLNRTLSALALASVLVVASHASAQNPPKPKRKNETGAQETKAPKSDSAKKAEKARTTHFFDSEAPLTMSLAFNYKKLKGDKDATTSPWRAATLTLTDAGQTDTIPVRVR